MNRLIQHKRLSGVLTGWDADSQQLRVTFKKWWEPGRSEGIASFLLDPYAIVTSTHRGTLTLSALAIGQRVTVTYFRRLDGQPIAKTLVVSKKPEPRRRMRVPSDDPLRINRESSG